MANSAVKVIIKVKGIPIRVIIDIKTNIFIITLLVIKKLQIIIGMPDKSKIIAID